MILNPNPRQTDSAKTRARNTCMHIWIVTDAAQDDVRKYRHGSLLFTQNSASCLGRKPQGAQPMDVGEHVEDPGLRTTSPSQSFSSPPSKPKGVVGCPQAPRIGEQLLQFAISGGIASENKTTGLGLVREFSDLI